eukprot:757257-Heterocapsa_arctica.AAC.1
MIVPVLALDWLECVDTDVHTVGNIIRMARDGKAGDSQQLLILPVWPNYGVRSGTRLGMHLSVPLH